MTHWWSPSTSDDAPLPLAFAELGLTKAQVVAGTAAPPQEVVDAVVVEPHGWRILRPI
jgi:cyclomaltodextrinase